MSWWTSVVNGVKTVGSGLSTGAKWVWNNASLTKLTTGLFTYTANTTFQVLEQGLALRNSVPTLVKNINVRKVVSGMAYIAINDVLPLVALNYANNGLGYANNSMQNYFRDGYEDEAWLSPYSAFLGTLTLAHYAVRAIDYGVKAYTIRQGVQSFMRITILDSVGPSAFNSNKLTPPPSLCTELDCNFKRKMKGMGREPLILLANDAFTTAISWFPYGGPTIAQVLRVFFNGRFITRSVTPERCERHKAMMQESVLALGLTYELSTMAMDYLLEATVGVPPFLYYRTMKHLLLLLHINNAAHMKIPLVEDKDATFWIDPLNVYERICRFMADVIFAGLMKRVPIDFKPVKGAPPLIPLSPALQFGTKLLNSDLESERKTEPGFFKKSFQTARQWIVPPILQEGGLNNDPIVSRYLPGIQKGSLYAVEIILSYRESKTKTTLGWIPPKGVALAINLKFGIPKKLTQFLLMLSNEEDFWEFLEALKLWFERNKGKPMTEEDFWDFLIPLKQWVNWPLQLWNGQMNSDDLKLVPINRLPLLGEKQLEPPPKITPVLPSLPPEQLVSSRSENVEVLSPEKLIPVKTPINFARTPQSLFTTRRRVENTTTAVDNSLGQEVAFSQ